MSCSISAAIDMALSIFLSPDLCSAGSHATANQVDERGTNALIVGGRWTARTLSLTATTLILCIDTSSNPRWFNHAVRPSAGGASLDAGKAKGSGPTTR